MNHESEIPTLQTICNGAIGTILWCLCLHPWVVAGVWKSDHYGLVVCIDPGSPLHEFPYRFVRGIDTSVD